MNIQNLLEVRARLKSRKPVFLREEAHKRKELSAKWRRPRGKRSKLRLGKGGHRKKPNQGLRSPKLVRGLHRTGLKLFRVCSLKELENLPKDFGVIVSSTIGQRKRLEIIKKAEQLKLKVVNIKPEEFLKRFEEKKAEKEKGLEEKEEEKKKEEEKGRKIAKKEREEKEEEKEQKELTEKERREAEKREKDKLLTKRLR